MLLAAAAACRDFVITLLRRYAAFLRLIAARLRAPRLQL